MSRERILSKVARIASISASVLAVSSTGCSAKQDITVKNRPYETDCQKVFHIPHQEIEPYKPDLINPLPNTPPLGYNPFNHFGPSITESTSIEIIGAMRANCMQQAGYEYYILDDGWQSSKLDSDGKLIADEGKFPRGIKYLADYAHTQGFKFGIYTAVGDATCMNLAGSLGNEKLHARQFADWGIDYIKLDWCGNRGVDYSETGAMDIARRWHEAIKATGRPMWLSISNGGGGSPWKWPKELINSWRVSGDVHAVFDSGKDGSVMFALNQAHYQESVQANTIGVNHFADLDMLQVGNVQTNRPKLSDEEARTQMTMWALASSPLIAGNDPREMTPATQATLVNPDVIAINQDPLAAPVIRLDQGKDIQVWRKQLANPNQIVIAYINSTDHNLAPTINLADYGLDNISNVYNIWSKEDYGSNTKFNTEIQSHGVILLLINK
jgi:alpha-galactosidase